ncbi:hypothetical protein BDC45DRAFT_515933 [Circinella umbellata]|nr:hypothetical protein BDC45DRAFT_515933 [Circinella umbellata]
MKLLFKKAFWIHVPVLTFIIIVYYVNIFFFVIEFMMFLFTVLVSLVQYNLLDLSMKLIMKKLKKLVYKSSEKTSY